MYGNERKTRSPLSLQHDCLPGTNAQLTVHRPNGESKLLENRRPIRSLTRSSRFRLPPGYHSVVRTWCARVQSLEDSPREMYGLTPMISKVARFIPIFTLEYFDSAVSVDCTKSNTEPPPRGAEPSFSPLVWNDVRIERNVQ